MNVAGDKWDDIDPRDSDNGQSARTAQLQKDLERAKLYRAAFVDSPAGRALLEQWDNEIRGMRVSVNATLSQFVAAETTRNFIQKIHDQIRLSTDGR